MKVKKPTKAQWQSVLHAMAKSYGESYAMMTEDAMKGFETKAKRLHLGAYYDGAVFGFLLQRVRAFRHTLSDDDITELDRRFEDDLL